MFLERYREQSKIRFFTLIFISLSFAFPSSFQSLFIQGIGLLSIDVYKLCRSALTDNGHQMTVVLYTFREQDCMRNR